MARTLPSIEETRTAAGTADTSGTSRAAKRAAAAERQLQIEQAAGIGAKTVAKPSGLIPAPTTPGATPTVTQPVSDLTQPQPTLTPTSATPLTPEAQAAKFTDVMNQVVGAGAKTAKDTMYGDLSTSFDNQLLVQRGLIYAALAGERLTPDELRVLSPAQQAAIRGANKETLQAEAFGINSILSGRAEAKKQETDAAFKKFDLFVQSGADPASLPPELFDQLDTQVGMPSGSFKAIYASEFAKSEQEKKDAALQAKILTSQYLDAVPLGESVTIDGIEYLGRSTDGIEVGADGHGRRFITMPDGSVSIQDLGLISPPQQNHERVVDDNGDVWDYDSTSGKYKLIASGLGRGLAAAGGDASVLWSQVLPDGTYFGGADFIDPATGQPFVASKQGACGAFVRWATGGGIQVGNSLEEKKKIIDFSIGTKDNPVQVGDAIILAQGGWTGHIGIVNAIKTDPEGRISYQLTESNRGLDGKITNNYKISADSSAIQGFARSPIGLRPELAIGTDNLNFTSGPHFNATAPETDTTAAAASVQSPESIEKANTILTLANDLLTDNALGRSVGPISSRVPVTRGDRADFIAKTNQLKSLLTLDNLGVMKGVLSDSDIKILTSAATSLDFGMSEDGFIAELKRIIDKVTYAPMRAQLLPGEMLVKKADGSVVAIPSNEYDASKYTQI